MIVLNKTHDPRKNAELLQQIKPLNISEALKETEQFFQQCVKKKFPGIQATEKSIPLLEQVQRPFSKRSTPLPPTKVSVDSRGNV